MDFLQSLRRVTTLPPVVASPRFSALPLPSWTGMLSDFIILCCCAWWWWWWCWWWWWWWYCGASAVLRMGTAGGGKLPPLAGGPTALPEAIAGAISFRPKFSKLLETLLMFSGAALALALERGKEKSSHPCQQLWQTQQCIHALFFKMGKKSKIWAIQRTYFITVTLERTQKPQG